VGLDPTVASASEIAAAIRGGVLSARDAVEACLARIAEVNPGLNAVVQLDAEGARRAAARADSERARGVLQGPLHGVPVTIKDSFDTAGLVSTWGTPGRSRFVPEADATAVARLRAAGAVVLGKTNTPELTLGFETVNPVYGRTVNPWSPDRTCGGSSGGAAAIVCVGGSALDIGSDTGGSIRLPAHCCGVAGLRPTSGRVPRTGHAIGPGGAIDFLTQVGPLARRVEDLALALRVLAGPDAHDPFVAPVPVGDPADVRLEGMRVALCIDNGIVSPDRAVAEACSAAARALEESGAHVVELRPPGIEETASLYPAVLLPDGGVPLRRLLEACGTPLEASSIAPLARMPAPTAEGRVDAIARWDAFRSRLLAWSRDWDLVLSPPHARPALGHGESQAELAGFSYTMTWNLAGWPAAVVRAGSAPGGLPVGVQLAAAPWREDRVLAAAARIEAALGGHVPPLTRA
jgi:amidase